MTIAGKEKPLGSVVLVHGIRTHADWYREVRDALQANGFRVHLTNYGRFDLVRFLLPFRYFRNRAKEKIFRQIRHAQQSEPGLEFSIIAHSFGTYVVSRILQDEFDLQIDRIIFAGSVVRYDFPFEQFSNRFRSDILNEVAAKDVWPAFAESITTGYGSAGTFGFKRPRIYDRWNNGGHSAVLNAKHARDYWLPFLSSGEIKPIEASSRVPFWIRLINFVRLKYWILFALLAGVALQLAVAMYAAAPVTIQMYPGDTGWQLSDSDLAADVNSSMDEICPVGAVLGHRCESWLARYITKRSWRGVHRYDHRLNDLLFPDELVYEYRDPERFWFDLSETYPNCIEITEIGDDLEIRLDKLCKLSVAK